MKKIAAKQIEGGVGGVIELAKIYNFVGTLSTKVGVSRWYPERNIMLKSAFVSVGVKHTGGTVVVNVLKNGEPLFSITLATDTFKTAVSTFEHSILTTDYLTVNVAANGGSDMALTITYQ